MRVDKGVPIKQAKGAWSADRSADLLLAAIGLEAEFELHVDERVVRPERLFRDPREIVRAPMMHRTGRSYHLPTGSAIYFDTGVIELATPAIEISRGCAARAGRSLWEAILYLRNELDAWDLRTRHVARLQGFSAHYNVSFESAAGAGPDRRVEDLALLLTYILPIPVMLLATNRASTGVGVRPRENRIEVTVDFTPSPSLMIATATLITGIVRSVMTWPSFDLSQLAARRIPVIAGFRPIPHTSRKGWLARLDCYPRSPFDCDVHRDPWRVDHAVDLDGEPLQELSLRGIGSSIFNRFRTPIRRLSDPFTYRMMSLVMNGRTSTLLDLPDRPEAYEDVGRLALWDNLFPESVLRRSMYERVLIRAISGQKLRMNGETYTPIGLRGWSEVVFRRDRDGARRRVGFDRLLRYLEKWERVS